MDGLPLDMKMSTFGNCKAKNKTQEEKKTLHFNICLHSSLAKGEHLNKEEKKGGKTQREKESLSTRNS